MLSLLFVVAFFLNQDTYGYEYDLPYEGGSGFDYDLPYYEGGSGFDYDLPYYEGGSGFDYDLPYYEGGSGFDYDLPYYEGGSGFDYDLPYYEGGSGFDYDLPYYEGGSGFDYDLPYYEGGSGFDYDLPYYEGGSGFDYDLPYYEGGSGFDYDLPYYEGGSGFDYDLPYYEGGSGFDYDLPYYEGGYSEQPIRNQGFLGGSPGISSPGKNIVDENGVPNIETMRNLELRRKQRVIQRVRQSERRKSRAEWDRENRTRAVQSIYREMRLKNPAPSRPLNSREQIEAMRTEVRYRRNNPRSSPKIRVNPSVTNIDRMNESRKR